MIFKGPKKLPRQTLQHKLFVAYYGQIQQNVANFNIQFDVFQ